MTSDLTFYDAAYPPSPAPTGFDGVAFYIGGDTPHVWTQAEIEATKTRYRLPIFTRSDPAVANVGIDVSVAISRLEAIGAPKGTLVALDSETSVDANYVAQFFYELVAADYKLIDYGSVSSVFGNHNPDGYYWGADWTDRPGVMPNTQMTQWVSHNSYDESTALATLPFWDTGAPVPAPAPAPTSTPTPQSGEVNVLLPLLIIGARGQSVKALQTLLGLHGYMPQNSGPVSSPDGIFGDGTARALGQCQHVNGLLSDSKAGKQTWTFLITGQVIPVTP